MRRSVLFFLLLSSLFFASCHTQSVIVDSVPEREANEMVVLLYSKGIQAEKVSAPVSTLGGGAGEKMWNIVVPANQVTRSLAVLNQSGLPRVKGTSLLDLFGTQGLVPSDLQDKIRYQEGLSEQLATTIRKMDGIIDANVQITFPKEEEEQEMTASVYVKHRGVLDNPNSLAITKIKRLISSAVPGLKPENVSVITDRALFADISLQKPFQAELEKEYVSIWTVVVTKDSKVRFRLIFYAFIIGVFLLVCALVWVIWKCLPIIQVQGGLHSLFQLEQYVLAPKPEKTLKEGENEDANA